MLPVSRTTSRSSNRNRALPPDRRASSSTSWRGSGSSSVAASMIVDQRLGRRAARARARSIVGHRSGPASANGSRSPCCVTIEDLAPIRARPARCAAAGRALASSRCWVSSMTKIVGDPDSSCPEEADRDLRQAIADEPLAEGGGLGRVRQVEAEQDAEQRDPRAPAAGRRRSTASPRRRDDDVGVGTRRRPRATSRTIARNGEVRRRRLVLLAAGVDRAGSPMARATTSSTSRVLPIPGSPGDLDDGALAAARALDRVEQVCELRLTPEQRDRRRGASP